MHSLHAVLDQMHRMHMITRAYCRVTFALYVIDVVVGVHE